MMMKFLPFLFLLALAIPAHAQSVINAAGCDPTSVQNALNSASAATTTVVIPSGTCAWTSRVTYAVPASVTNLTVQGQTTVTCTGTPGTSGYACIATDNTTFIDEYAVAAAPILTISVGGASSYFRMTGIAFKGGTLSSGNNKPNGFMTFTGSSQNFRVDHCDFNTTTYSVSNFGGGLTIYSPINGVFDHDTFELSGENNGIRDYSGIADYGDTVWSQATNFGTSGFIFAENDVFTGGAANDCDDGGKMVIRYSTIVSSATESDTGLWQGHAPGQGQQRSRGCRALEIYNNYIYNPNPSGNNEYSAGGGNVGTGLVWNNTISSGYSNDVIFENLRTLGTGHTQTVPPNGIGYCGNESSGVTAAWDGNSSAVTGYPCINQTGRGQGDLINGRPFPNMLDTVTGTITWPHQLLEPWYVWNETMASGQIYNAPAWNGVPMVVNRDFYVPASPFTGSSGTGFGLLASRPSTCTAGPGGTYGASPTGSYGVAYFATDANSGQGELYVCTSSNTWTPVYEPYTYPHPLDTSGTSGTGQPLGPPTNLQATVQ